MSLLSIIPVKKTIIIKIIIFISSKILERVSYDVQYNRDDFTVEYLTTLVDNIPRVTNSGGRQVLDMSLLAPDCFHFMKELHSRVGV